MGVCLQFRVLFMLCLLANSLHVCMYVSTYVCRYVCTYVICTYVCNMYVYLGMYVCMRVCAYIRMYNNRELLCVCVCVCVREHTLLCCVINCVTSIICTDPLV